jgi:hypothetical protein
MNVFQKLCEISKIAAQVMRRENCCCFSRRRHCRLLGVWSLFPPEQHKSARVPIFPPVRIKASQAKDFNFYSTLHRLHIGGGIYRSDGFFNMGIL